jgi:hypothetical protein
MSKIVFSRTLEEPLTWTNTQLIPRDAVQGVRELKDKEDASSMRTMGSLTLCRSLLEAGLVDRLRVVVFPVITGSTGSDWIYDGYPDVALDMIAAGRSMVASSCSSTFLASWPVRLAQTRRRLNARKFGGPVAELLGIARFKFHEGKLDEYKRLSARAMEIVRTKDTGTLQYDTYLNEDQSSASSSSGTGTPRRPSSTPRTWPTSRRRSLRLSPWFTANSSVSRAQS